MVLVRCNAGGDFEKTRVRMTTTRHRTLKTCYVGLRGDAWTVNTRTGVYLGMLRAIADGVASLFKLSEGLGNCLKHGSNWG